jgi:hypothetical protein
MIIYWKTRNYTDGQEENGVVEVSWEIKITSLIKK